MVTGAMLLVIFAVAIALLLLAILVLKLDPFLALLLTAILTAFLVRMPVKDISSVIANAFGSTLGGIGIVIGLGVILGKILAEANATDQIANSMLGRVGEKNAGLAINLTGYVVSIPVFFDAAFVILQPLIKNLSKKTGKSILYFITALAIGLITTHALVIPTPGPVAVAGNMKIDMGWFLLYALIISLPASLVGGWFYASRLGKRLPEVDSSMIIATDAEIPVKAQGTKPAGALCFFVLLLPILLILLGSIFILVFPKGSSAYDFFNFIGNKNNALLIGVLVAIVTMKKYVTKPMNKIIAESAESTGLILLITGAGGAFGAVINASGIGKYLVTTMQGWSIPLIVLAFVLSQILRAAQGSTTVALITTSSILGPVALAAGASPMLLALAICAGGIGLSLPNDSGFWVVSRFGGLSVKDTFRTWTAGGTIAGLTAFAAILVLGLFKDVLPGMF
jgi:gluconate:H+ symporter, GntP family